MIAAASIYFVIPHGIYFLLSKDKDMQKILQPKTYYWWWKYEGGEETLWTSVLLGLTLLILTFLEIITSNATLLTFMDKYIVMSSFLFTILSACCVIAFVSSRLIKFCKMRDHASMACVSQKI